MDIELPTTDQDRAILRHMQEIEYALILNRMINTVKDDPAQMRLAIYQFARARLNIDTSWADTSERERISLALETAIEGVEQFSIRQEQNQRIQPRLPTKVESDLSPSAVNAPAGSGVIPPSDIFAPKEVYRYPEIHISPRFRRRFTILLPFCFGVSLCAVVALIVSHGKWGALLSERSWPTSKAIQEQSVLTSPSEAVPPSSVPAAGEQKTGSSAPANLLLPSDYGVYASNNGALSELHLLPERVPDKRIAVSTPVTQPSRTVLSDGKASFILFRRDVAQNAPERMEVRVVAQVVRALTFDKKGNRSFLPVTDAWNIRNSGYEFRVRPIPGNPEMLLVQPEKYDFVLPAGRYVLVLRDQGYDFTIAGKVTDVAQCLERTDAANGEFYSECQKL